MMFFLNICKPWWKYHALGVSFDYDCKQFQFLFRWISLRGLRHYKLNPHRGEKGWVFKSGKDLFCNRVLVLSEMNKIAEEEC